MLSKKQAFIFIIIILISSWVFAGDIHSERTISADNADFLTWEHGPGFIVPSPFCSNFGVGFLLKDSTQVCLKFYDLGGHLIKVMERYSFAEGRHIVMLNPDDFRPGYCIVVAETNKGKFAKLDRIIK